MAEQILPVVECIKEKYVAIRTLFIKLAAKSNYPTITWNDFTEFCRENRIVDKACKLSDIDRMFIATTANLATIEDKNKDISKELNRYEFIEILVRISIAKYKEPTPAECFRKLMQYHLSL